MPACVIGGVSLVLYGMISAVGIRNLVENHVDFMKSRNVLITALVLVLSLGIAYSPAAAIVIPAGEITISLSAWQSAPLRASCSTSSCRARTATASSPPSSLRPTPSRGCRSTAR